MYLFIKNFNQKSNPAIDCRILFNEVLYVSIEFGSFLPQDIHLEKTLITNFM